MEIKTLFVVMPNTYKLIGISPILKTHQVVVEPFASPQKNLLKLTSVPQVSMTFTKVPPVPMMVTPVTLVNVNHFNSVMSRLHLLMLLEQEKIVHTALKTILVAIQFMLSMTPTQSINSKMLSYTVVHWVCTCHCQRMTRTMLP